MPKGHGHENDCAGQLKKCEDQLARRQHELAARNDELGKKVSELRIVSELGQALLAAASSSEALHTATEMMGAHFEASHACTVAEQPGGQPKITHAYNLTPDKVAAVNNNLGATCPEIVQAVIKAKRGQLIVASLDHAPTRCCGFCKEARALLCLPIRSPGRLSQFIVVFLPYTRDWTPEEKRFLLAVGDQIALTLENSLLVQEVNSKNVELKMANRLKSQLLANVSHELRTPLNSIIGFAEILEERAFGDLTERQSKYVTNIVTSGKHLLQLINDILDLAKVEAGRMVLQIEPFDVRETLEGILTVVGPLAKKKKVALRLDAEEGVGQIAADPARFKQIFYNLLSNGIKFTPEGGRVDLYVTLRPDGQLQISVTDTGIGIRPEDQGRVFAKFQQADGGLSREHEGTGLGLPLTKSLIEMHGGEISLKSELGKGSVFTVVVPLSPAQPEDTAEAAEDSLLPTPTAEDLEVEQTVVVVEPDSTVRQMFSRWLSDAGYSVVDTDHGSDVLALAKALKPALITLDILLPDKDGWAVLEELRETPETKDIPVVVISSVDSRNLAFSLGASDYLVKPVANQQLITMAKNIAARDSGPEAAVSCLIIADSPASRQELTEALEARGLAVTFAPDLKVVGPVLAAEQPDVVLLAPGDPERQTNDIRAFRDLAAIGDTPVIAVAPENYDQTTGEILSTACDALVKAGDGLRDELASAIERLHLSSAEKALIDPVTGLFNARSFHRQLAREISRCTPGGEISVVLAEIEGFSALREKNPALSEIILKTVGKLLKNDSRFYDFCGRYGGEKFALVLPQTPKQATNQKAQRIAELVRREAFFPTGTGRRRLNLLTAVVAYPQDGETPAALAARACEILRQVSSEAHPPAQAHLKGAASG